MTDPIENHPDTITPAEWRQTETVLTIDEAWLELCEKSDRDSGHPDMCLITREELAEFMGHDRSITLTDALSAWRDADRADAEAQELAERSFGEGWNDDPTGLSHITSAYSRAQKLMVEARQLRDAALGPPSDCINCGEPLETGPWGFTDCPACNPNPARG